MDIENVKTADDLAQFLSEVDDELLSRPAYKAKIQQKMMESAREIANVTMEEGRENHISKEDLLDTLYVTAEFAKELSSDVSALPDYSKDKQEMMLQFLGIYSDVAAIVKNEYDEDHDVTIYVEKISEHAVLPTYAHPEDAASDLYASETVIIEPWTTVPVKTGLKVAMPIGWQLAIRPRSGMSYKTPIRVSNAPGTIDAGYPDELMVLCWNASDTPYVISIGDRIAQMLPERVYKAKYELVDSAAEYRKADRTNAQGQSGLGSSGK